MLAPGVSYPVISLNVNVLQTAANPVTNTATVSGGSEIVTTNDTAADVTAVVSSADLAITKTASPTQPRQGNTDTYTLTVTNNGPSNATNVVVTDTLPTAFVSYVSATPNQGSCSQAGGVVTCNLGALNSGATATIAIVVTAVTRTGASSAVNTASVTATEPDPNSANNTATATITIISPTQVSLESFTATQTQDGVLLSWKTSGETRNLGFNVYEENENGARVQLNPSLIAGSALRIRGGLEQHAAKTYGWIDRSAGAGGHFYWLEDVDLQGTRTLHGPVSPATDVATPSPQRAQLNTDLNSSNSPSPQRAQLITDLNSSNSPTIEQTPDFSSGPPRAERAHSSNDDRRRRRDIQFKLAAHPAVKILVRREGWYRVTQPELLAAGLDNAVDPRFLQLFAEGREQSIRIAGATDGPGGFASEGSIEFYATGIDTPYSDTRVYWLVVGDKPGKRIAQEHASETEGDPPASYPYVVELRPRTTYFAALLKPNTDNFFGALVSSAPVDVVLNARNIAGASTKDITLAVVLQGVVEGAPHDVRVSWNGTTLGDLNFVGQDEGKLSLVVPRELIQEGANTVTLTAQAGENDLSLVDTIRLEYPHTYTAESDTLEVHCRGRRTRNSQRFCTRA